MSSKLLSWLLGTASKNSARVRPSLEALEDRLAPSPTIRPAGALPPLVSALPIVFGTQVAGQDEFSSFLRSFSRWRCTSSAVAQPAK